MRAREKGSGGHTKSRPRRPGGARGAPASLPVREVANEQSPQISSSRDQISSICTICYPAMPLFGGLNEGTAYEARADSLKWPFHSINSLFYWTLGPSDFPHAMPWVLLYLFSAFGDLFVWSLLGAAVSDGGAVVIGIVLFLTHGVYFYARGLSSSLADLAPTLQRYRPSPSIGTSPIEDSEDAVVTVAPIETAAHTGFAETAAHQQSLARAEDSRAAKLAAFAYPIVLSAIAFSAGVYNNVTYFQENCVCDYVSTLKPVLNGFMILSVQLLVILAAAHLAGLKALCLIHQRRMVHLRDMLRDCDVAAITGELAADTQVHARALLARPQPSEPSAPRWCFPSTNSPLDSTTAVVVNPLIPSDAQVDVHKIDQFLCVYNAVRLELVAHAKRWQAPALIYVAGAALLFVSLALGSIKSLIAGTMPAFSIWFAGMLGLLLLLVLNLLPAVSLNSFWPQLIATHCTNLSEALLWRKWSPSERIVLSSYFSSHPLVFPIGGITFTWGGVQAIVVTALSPTLVAALSQVVKTA